MPATPVMSTLGSPSRSHFRRAAISRSFMRDLHLRQARAKILLGCGGLERMRVYTTRAAAGRRLFAEEFGLVGGSGGFAAAGDPDDAENGHFRESGGRDENPERIAMKVWRSETHAVLDDFYQIVGDDALDGVLVAKRAADPQALEFRATQECFPLRRLQVGEFADEVNGLEDRKSTRLNSSHMSISYAV